MKNKFTYIYVYVYVCVYIRNTTGQDIDNKLLIYTMILKPIWAYEIQFWRAASAYYVVIIYRHKL